MSEYEPELWEKREDEGDKPWEAFMLYRDAGIKRSHTAVTVELHKSMHLISRWSKRHEWRKRVLQFDRWMDEEARKDQVIAVKEMRRRHAAVAMMAMAKAVEKLRVVAGDTMTVRDAATLFDLSVKVERMARGEPDQMTQVTGTAPVTLLGLAELLGVGDDDE